MIANAKDLTAERESAMLQDKEKRDLLDFSDANVNFQEFEGVDYKALAGHGDMQFMEMMQVRVPQSATQTHIHTHIHAPPLRTG